MATLALNHSRWFQSAGRREFIALSGKVTEPESLIPKNSLINKSRRASSEAELRVHTRLLLLIRFLKRERATFPNGLILAGASGRVLQRKRRRAHVLGLKCQRIQPLIGDYDDEERSQRAG